MADKPLFTIHRGGLISRPLREPEVCAECDRALTDEGHHVVVCVPDWRGKHWGGR